MNKTRQIMAKPFPLILGSKKKKKCIHFTALVLSIVLDCLYFS